MSELIPDYLLVVYIAGLIFVIFILFFYWNKHKKDRKELSSIAQYKVREIMLDQTLHNPYNENDIGIKQDMQTPYHVDYENKSGGKKQLNNQVMIQITEWNDFTVKKYILDPMKSILIGSNRNENSIVTTDEKIAPMQFEIFPHDNKLYLRDMRSGVPTNLIRGKTKHIVNEVGIGIRNKDTIIAGNTRFEITIVK